MITAGIDCGAKTTKAALLKDGAIIGKGLVPTGFDQDRAVRIALSIAAQQAGISPTDIQRIFGTGSGKSAVRIADGTVNDIKAMARALEVGIDEMGPLCLQSGRQITLNAQCAIFAESEVIGLIHSMVSKPDISRAIHDAIAARVVSMIRRIGVKEDVVLLGGLARNPGFTASMTRQLKVSRLYTPSDPEFGAAVGAAVAAAEEAR